MISDEIKPALITFLPGRKWFTWTFHCISQLQLRLINYPPFWKRGISTEHNVQLIRRRQLFVVTIALCSCECGDKGSTQPQCESLSNLSTDDKMIMDQLILSGWCTQMPYEPGKLRFKMSVQMQLLIGEKDTSVTG